MRFKTDYYEIVATTLRNVGFPHTVPVNQLVFEYYQMLPTLQHATSDSELIDILVDTVEKLRIKYGVKYPTMDDIKNG